MLRNETTEDFIKRIGVLGMKDEFSMFEPEEIELYTKLCEESGDQVEAIQKPKENGFSEFKAGIALTLYNISSRYLVLNPQVMPP